MSAGYFCPAKWNLSLNEQGVSIALAAALTKYITKACSVSIFVVRKKFARPRAVSVPSLKLSIKLLFETPKSCMMVDSSKLTTPENIAAKTILCTELGGSIPRETSSQKASYSFSNVGLWMIFAIGCTASKYCLINLSAANRVGRKSIKDATWPPCPKKKPDAGAIYAGPGLSHSLVGGSGSID